jgi:inactivated superfamily I helicase
MHNSYDSKHYVLTIYLNNKNQQRIDFLKKMDSEKKSYQQLKNSNKTQTWQVHKNIHRYL